MLKRTLVTAALTVATVGSVAWTILPSENNTPVKVQEHQQHAWAEYEKERLHNEYGRLPSPPAEPDALAPASDAGAAESGAADDAAEGMVDAILKH